MKSKNIFLIFLSIMLIMISCSEDFLERKPLGEFSELDVFQDPVLIETYVNGIYTSVKDPGCGGGGMLKAEFVDEAHDMWYQYFEFNNCLISVDNLRRWTRFEYWDNVYPNIRRCNIFLEKVDMGQFDNTLVDGKPLKERLTGEVHFLRAWFYHHLASLYGGVPIIEKTYGLTDDFKIARNTYAETIEFIVKECDLAASMLPEVNTGKNRGRATKGAALALKAEALLYAASDLHNNHPMFSSFEKPELLGYTSGSRQERWLAAKNAAKAVMDLNLYSLHKAYPAPADAISLNPVSQNYADIFILNETEEDIYVRMYISKYGGITGLGGVMPNDLPLATGPNGYHLYGQDTPIGNLVDDYEMSDGTRFDWNNPAHAAEPYKNRDPRFYASILYEGVKWIARNTDGIPIDPIGVVQCGTWERWDAQQNKMVEVYGLDTRKGPIEPYNGGYTGYYLRKFIDPKFDGRFSGQDAPWRYFRYAEILLNYAEACLELGEEAEARTYINMIRERAGMPAITESGAALKERYRHERRIELAMEDNRFYDVRRWVIGPEAYNITATGVDIRYKLDPVTKVTATIPTIVPIDVQSRAWLDKAYFLPIMRAEMNKNSLLINNPGYPL